MCKNMQRCAWEAQNSFSTKFKDDILELDELYSENTKASLVEQIKKISMSSEYLTLVAESSESQEISQ